LFYFAVNDYKKMPPICVFNEWDPLREVIVGRASYARIARPDLSLFAVEYREYGAIERIPSGPYPDQVISETEEDLEALVSELEKLDIGVHRPEEWRHDQTWRTPDWETDGQYNFCPRDLFISIDRWLIEAPMTLRCRQFETLSFKPLMLNLMQRGARWISAPRPRLTDEVYCPNGHSTLAIAEIEPMFDAANVLRLGEDLLYLVSDTGNRLGAAWLQSVLGPEYRVHVYDNIYSGSHIDTTIAPIRPGLVVVNAERIGPHNLPDLFTGWNVIYLADVIDIGFIGTSYASKWIGMNLLMVRPDLAIVDAVQRPLIGELERRGIDVIPLRMRHARTLGGGFHCVTLDVRRDGECGSYCNVANNSR
jgi:N-dimethylarginine dimethylaminohydrolase